MKTPARATDQGTPQTASKKPQRVTIATHKGIVPILFAAWDHVPGAVSLTEFMDQIHRQLRIKHPEVADQIKTLVRQEPEAPVAPPEPDSPGEYASPQEFEMWKTLIQVYMLKMQVHAKAFHIHEAKLEKLQNYEKACIAEFLEYISDQLTEKIKLDIPELDVCSDIPRVVTAVKKYHAESNVKSSRRIMLHAYLAHALIKMRTDETLFAYHKRYVESMRKLSDSGFNPLDDDMEAIKFIESLPSETFGEWQVSLVNREHDAQITGDAENTWPRTVSEAYTIANSRISAHGRSKHRYDIDIPVISTINKAVARGADSEGRGGGTRKGEHGSMDREQKSPTTHAARPEKSEDGDKECLLCEGAFNHMTKGKSHWVRDCPITMISSKKKAEMFSKLLSNDKEESDEQEKVKTDSANAAVRFRAWAEYDSDSDDSKEYSRYATIMGTAGK